MSCESEGELHLRFNLLIYTGKLCKLHVRVKMLEKKHKNSCEILTPVDCTEVLQFTLSHNSNLFCLHDISYILFNVEYKNTYVRQCIQSKFPKTELIGKGYVFQKYCTNLNSQRKYLEEPEPKLGFVLF